MEQEGPGIHIRGAPGRCPGCVEGFDDGAPVVACGACGAKHHASCWREASACVRCGGDRPLHEREATPRPRPPAPVATPRSRRGRFVAGVGALLLVIAGVAARTWLGAATLRADVYPSPSGEVEVRGALLTPILRGARVDVSGVRATLDSAGGFAVRLRLSEGTHALDVRASTWARSVVERRTVLVDFTPPVVDLDGSLHGTTFVGPGEAQVTGRVRDSGGPIRVRVGEQSAIVASHDRFTLNVPLSQGLHRLTLTAADARENVSSVELGTVLVVPEPVSGEVRLGRTSNAGEGLNAPDASTLAWLPPGSFPSRTEGTVVFRRGLWFATRDVTVGQFRAFCTATGRAGPVGRPAEEPVRDLSREQVEAYCAWAGLRLPTRLELERAVASAAHALSPLTALAGDEWTLEPGVEGHERSAGLRVCTSDAPPPRIEGASR